MSHNDNEDDDDDDCKYDEQVSELGGEEQEKRYRGQLKVGKSANDAYRVCTSAIMRVTLNNCKKNCKDEPFLKRF